MAATSPQLCNVCGVGSVYRTQIGNEVLRICAGCANVHSQPNPDGPLAGWKRHGVKLTTNKQIEESENQRRQAILKLDQLSSSMGSLRLRMTKDMQKKVITESKLRLEIATLKSQLNGEEKHDQEAVDHEHWHGAVSDISTQLDNEKFINENLRTEAARAKEAHEQEVASLKEALRQIHAKNAHEKWNKLRKAGAHDIVETIQNVEKKRLQREHKAEIDHAADIELKKTEVGNGNASNDGTTGENDAFLAVEESIEGNEEGLIGTLRQKLRRMNFSIAALIDTIEDEREIHEIELDKCFGYIQELEQKVAKLESKR